MDRILRLMRALLLLTCLTMSVCSFANLRESHGYAQFGELKYPASFTHFAWVNPDAPKGGSVRVMALAPSTPSTLTPSRAAARRQRPISPSTASVN